jgi:hypothetical protein
MQGAEGVWVRQEEGQAEALAEVQAEALEEVQLLGQDYC